MWIPLDLGGRRTCLLYWLKKEEGGDAFLHPLNSYDSIGQIVEKPVVTGNNRRLDSIDLANRGVVLWQFFQSRRENRKYDIQ